MYMNKIRCFVNSKKSLQCLGEVGKISPKPPGYVLIRFLFVKQDHNHGIIQTANVYNCNYDVDGGLRDMTR